MNHTDLSNDAELSAEDLASAQGGVLTTNRPPVPIGPLGVPPFLPSLPFPIFPRPPRLPQPPRKPSTWELCPQELC
jgi:hypothetical protein